MNNKAQTVTPFRVFFVVMAFLMIYVLFLNDFLDIALNQALTTGGYTGIEAFLLMNIKLIMLFCLLLVIIVGLAVSTK